MTRCMYAEIKYLFVIFTFTFMSGCMIIPYTEEEDFFERQIDEELLGNIERGKTTSLEILDWFGKPNAIVASGAPMKAPSQDLRKKGGRYVKSQDFLKMFSAKHNFTKKHVVYYYETSTYYSWRLLLFVFSLQSGMHYDDKPVGKGGLKIRKLWILIDSEKGHVVDYIFLREKGKSSNASITTSVVDTKSIVIRIETNKGNIVLELYPDKAPKTVANFLQYIEDGFYENTIFHRVINGFMIQGGGFDTNYKRKNTRPPIINEADNGLKNISGTISMARTLEPHSATSQFFINVSDNYFLDHLSKNPRDWGYAVFGKVVEGIGVVNLIKNIQTIFRFDIY